MKAPRQFEFPFALWTRAIIGKVILDRYGIRLSRVSLRRLLSKLGLTCQRPLYRATEQNRSLVEAWGREEYPAIKARAAAEDGEIFFADESPIRSDHHSGPTWAPAGETPVVAAAGQQCRLNMLSAISAKGALSFMVCGGRVASPQIFEFADRLMHGRGKKVFLVVDCHSMNRSKAVKEHLAKFNSRLELCILPPYSPELNSDELVWNHVKTHTVGKVVSRSLVELREHVESFLTRIQSLPHIVRTFFMTPETRYAL
jgi:transposase